MTPWLSDRFSRLETVLAHATSVAEQAAVLLRTELESVQNARAELDV